RFYGLTYAGGIKTLTISNPPGIELDHIQYGLGTAVDRDSTVPEPASWALMILGFGMAGGMLRRRERRGAAAA
ncbi:MAG: hypothetical protein JWQ29_1116, partial [Phenylobacterium sp.]|nr:hypothetical protein [Phenylobacterium sp.]